MAAKILSDVMTRHVDTVAPRCPISTAAWIMKDDRISSLVVVENGKGVGMLTERDIVRAMHLDLRYETPVSAVMGTPLLAVGSSMEFHAAVRLACERGVRHLVVAGGDGVPLGICTASDFRYHIDHSFYVRHRLVHEATDLEPVLVSPQSPIRDVADRLVARNVPAAIVVEGRRAVGIVSERTLTRIFAGGVDPGTPVADHMATPLRILLGDGLLDASRLMQSARRRHLVVEDEFGRAVGLLAGDRLLYLLRNDYENSAPDDRRFIERQRRADDEHLRLSLEAVEDGLWDWDIPVDRLRLSALGLDLLGCAPEAAPVFAFAEWQARVHPEDFAAAWAEIESCVEGSAAFAVDFRLRRGDGGWLWTHCRGKAVEFDADGHPRRMVGTLSDATERFRMLHALRESEGKYRSILASMAEGVMVHDADGRIVECNPAAERILGLAPSHIRGSDDAKLYPEAVQADGSPFSAEAHPAAVALRTGEPVRDVVMGVRKPDGSLSWLRVNAEPLRIDPNAAPYGVVATFSDITPFFRP
ncbi:MAG: CBS domain-containing protein [Candidatus Nitricoxidivorans perseverans]|uniref:CBS domain-containing protein n=1 Tax=Candidatus Nitricoxidivorans perseverans TaxID=2975601 RepID=A0AA49FJT2_9PROT|nr:MAG: CBS domain-containing protein [Candidatus Nitricoxidivorans perseverans]